MTTKEFVRRSQYYQVLDSAAALFSEYSSEYVYKLVIYDSENKRFDLFSTYASTDILEVTILTDCQSIYIDRYSFIQFKVDFGYFRAFLNRCSVYQLKVLRESGNLSNLFNLLDDNQK